MTYLEAIRTCLTKYVDFDGRASRSEFWWFMLFVWAGIVVLSIFSETLAGVFCLATLLPICAATARRLHDTDRTGWLQLIGIIPIVGLVLFYFLVLESKEPNRYGELKNAGA